MGEFFAGIPVWAGTFFVVGTIWFWVVSVAIFVWLIYLTEGESHILAGLALLGFIWVVSSVNEFSILAEPLTALKWLGFYLGLGVVWSFFKWFSFLFSKRDELKAHKNDFVKRFSQPLTADGKISPQDMDDFIKFLNDQGYSSKSRHNSRRTEEIKSQQDIIPSVDGRFGDLTRWIIWWPFSAFWTILNDPFRRLAEALVRMFRGAYTKLANSVFASEI